ncbi:MAG: LysM peptidoglycan-binding domain-containing protein [Chlamydia sp.]
MFSFKAFQFSLFLNMFLAVLCSLFFLRSATPTLIIEQSAPLSDRKNLSSFSEDSTLCDITCYVQMSDEQLMKIAFLPPEPLFFGLTSIDISLSLLYARGYTIDQPLKKIQRWPQSRVEIPFQDERGKPQQLLCFTSLQSEDAAAIQKYMHSEKAPYTAQKLCSLLKKREEGYLKEALYRSQEWYEVKSLLGSIFTTDEKLVRYLLLFSWEGFKDHIAMAKIVQQDASWKKNGANGIQKYLLQAIVKDFMRTHSPRLASCLMMTRNPALFQSAPAEFFVALFNAVPESFSSSTISFAMDLLKSSAQDSVFQAAQKYVASQWRIQNGERMDRQEFLLVLQERQDGTSRGIERLKPSIHSATKKSLSSSRSGIEEKPKLNSSATASYKIYTVRKGDTLWSISKAFHVHVDKIRYLNRVHGSSLSPGRILKIPTRVS